MKLVTVGDSIHKVIGGSKGALGMCTPPLGLISFIFVMSKFFLLDDLVSLTYK